MRKFFYGISIFLFLCIVSFAYYSTYGLAGKLDSQEVKERESKEEQNLQMVSSVEESGYGKYYLKEEKGYVVVYKQDKTTVFETTEILISFLPTSLQEEIRKGKYIKTEKELYSFLENYSS